MKEKIKSIIFDVGGVLALPRGKSLLHPQRGHRELGVHEEIAKKLKISVDQWFDSIDTIYSKSIEGKVSEEKIISVISKNIKVSKKKLTKIIIKSYRKKFKQNKKLYKLAFKLKKQKYKIAILSDQWHLSKEALILPKYFKKFDKVVVSCDVGIRKPNMKIYKLILKELKIPAKNCLFIDNQEWNIKPAKKLGMKTILFKDNKKTFKELKKIMEKNI